jgi:hypothetical protein
LALLLSGYFAAGGERLAAQFAAIFSGKARAHIHFILITVHDTFALSTLPGASRIGVWG